LPIAAADMQSSKAFVTLQPCCSRNVQATYVQEYVRRLGTLLVGLQEDPQAPDRPCLDTWVAEARALICCIRAYNPEALKKLETSGLYNSVSVEQDLSASFCTQQLVSGQDLAVTALCAMPACRYIRFLYAAWHQTISINEASLEELSCLCFLTEHCLPDSLKIVTSRSNAKAAPNAPAG